MHESDANSTFLRVCLTRLGWDKIGLLLHKEQGVAPLARNFEDNAFCPHNVPYSLTLKSQ